ncbi:MAG: hypothetical protein D6808_01215 [Candidatus Dadabacteria bacterium]|nr:MAG: hypothetical protein D6808_01215 [Candidatus Dadabacteria bacterium]
MRLCGNRGSVTLLASAIILALVVIWLIVYIGTARDATSGMAESDSDVVKIVQPLDSILESTN